MNKQQTADYYKMSIPEYDAMIERLAETTRKENSRILAESSDVFIIIPIYNLLVEHGVCTEEGDGGQFSGGYYDEVYEYEGREYTFLVGPDGIESLCVRTKKEKE